MASKYNHQVGSMYIRKNEYETWGKSYVTFDIRCVVTIGEEVVDEGVRDNFGVFTVTVYSNKIIVKTDEVTRPTMNAWARKSVEVNNLEYLVRNGRTVVSTLRDALKRYRKNRNRYKVRFDIKAIEKIIDDFEKS